MNIITIRRTQRWHRETSRNVDETPGHRARAGDRCLRDRDNCAHLSVVNRVHNKCVWVRGMTYAVRCAARLAADYGARVCTPPRPRARRVKGMRGTARSGLRAHCSRPPNKPHTERYWSLVSSPENDPATNRSRKREDDCPQSPNSSATPTDLWSNFWQFSYIL